MQRSRDLGLARRVGELRVDLVHQLLGAREDRRVRGKTVGCKLAEAALDAHVRRLGQVATHLQLFDRQRLRGVA